MSNHANLAVEKVPTRSRVKENGELRPTRRGGQNRRIERTEGRQRLFQALQKAHIRKGLDLKAPELNPEAPTFIPQPVIIPDPFQVYASILLAPTPVKPWAFAAHLEGSRLDPDAPEFYPSASAQHLPEESLSKGCLVSVCHCNSNVNDLTGTRVVKNAEEIADAGADFSYTLPRSSTIKHTRCRSVSIPEKPEWKVVIDEPTTPSNRSNEQVSDTTATPDVPAADAVKEQSVDSIPTSQVVAEPTAEAASESQILNQVVKAIAEKPKKAEVSSKNAKTSLRSSNAKVSIVSNRKQQPFLSDKGKEGKDGKPLLKANKLPVSRLVQTTKALPTKSTLPTSSRKTTVRSTPSLVAKNAPLRSVATSASQSPKPPISTSRLQTGSRLALPTTSSRSRSLNDSEKPSLLQARNAASTVAVGKASQKALPRPASRLPKAELPTAKKTETKETAKATRSELSRHAVAKRAVDIEKAHKVDNFSDQRRKDSAPGVQQKRRLNILEFLESISVTGNCWL